MRLLYRIRLSSKLQCVAVFLSFAAILSIIKPKINSSSARNETSTRLRAEQEVAYMEQDGNNEIFLNDDGEVVHQDCGGLSKLIALKSFVSQPKIFSIPQNISLSIAFEILEDLIAPIKVNVTIWKRLPWIDYHIRLPCIANYGSCVFQNVCDTYEKYSVVSKSYSVACPRWFRATGIKCKCPFRKGIYSVKEAPGRIDSSMVPRWIAMGDYTALLTFEGTSSGSSGSETLALGCFKFMFRLT